MAADLLEIVFWVFVTRKGGGVGWAAWNEPNTHQTLDTKTNERELTKRGNRTTMRRVCFFPLPSSKKDPARLWRNGKKGMYAVLVLDNAEITGQPVTLLV